MFLALGPDNAASSVVVALLVQTFGVGGIECISLPRQDELVLRLHLVRVIGASRMRDAHPLVVHVEDEVVLAHQGAAD